MNTEVTFNPMNKAWSEKATARLAKIAEGQMPDAMSNHARVWLIRQKIKELRSKGYTWKAIASMLADPEIGIQISHASLRRYVSEKPGTRKDEDAKKKQVTEVQRTAAAK